MNFDDANTKQVNLQNRSHQYDKPHANLVNESQHQVSIKPMSSSNGALQIPPPKVEVIPQDPQRFIMSKCFFY